MLKDSKFKIWELIDKFEDWISKEKDWKVNRFYDLIQVNNEYYKFIWTQNFHTETFKKIVTKQSCSLGNHRSYQTVEASYIVWILAEKPEMIVWNIIKNTPCLSKRVAIYCVNKSFSGIINYLKLNETENIVLAEFEDFLDEECGIKPKSFTKSAPNMLTKYVT